VYTELDLVLELKIELSEFEKRIKIEILAFQNMKNWAQTDIWITQLTPQNVLNPLSPKLIINGVKYIAIERPQSKRLV
jgi:hypothetical protein